MLDRIYYFINLASYLYCVSLHIKVGLEVQVRAPEPIVTICPFAE